MTGTPNERARALQDLAVGYAHDIGTKLAADILADGFQNFAEGFTLMQLTFTECAKEHALRIAQVDKKIGVDMLEMASAELARCATLLRDA